MVEFALAALIALTLIIGLMEVGRLLFSYVTVYTASREAARYGSTVGLNTSGIPSYYDCEGIVAAAQLGGAIPMDQVEIRYDTGPRDTRPWEELPTCPREARMGERIIVRTRLLFRSPFFPAEEPIQITSTAARTILRDIELGDETWP